MPGVASRASFYCSIVSGPFVDLPASGIRCGLDPWYHVTPGGVFGVVVPQSYFFIPQFAQNGIAKGLEIIDVASSDDVSINCVDADHVRLAGECVYYVRFGFSYVCTHSGFDVGVGVGFMEYRIEPLYFNGSIIANGYFPNQEYVIPRSDES